MKKSDQQAFEAWLATRKPSTVYDRRDLEMAWLDGRRQGDAVTQQRDELVEAYQEAREAILNERYGMAEAGFTGDQINDVLGVLDDAFAARIQSTQPQGEWVEIVADGSNLPDLVDDGFYKIRLSNGAQVWDGTPRSWCIISGSWKVRVIAFWSIPHIDRRPDVPEYQPRKEHDEQ